MSDLARTYRVNETNLRLRRAYIGLGQEEIRVLARLHKWADANADAIGAELTAHTFDFAPTRAFLDAYVAQRGITIDDLRRGWSSAQSAHFKQIFQVAADGGDFGVSYFGPLLHVGKLHNSMNLPLKWYMGTYPKFFDIVRAHLRKRYPHRPRLRFRAERAILAVFNYDVQAITDAFYTDAFASMGVDVDAIEVDDHAHDISDAIGAMKETVRETISALTTTVEVVSGATHAMRLGLHDSGGAIEEIAATANVVAEAAERQAHMLTESRRLAEETLERMSQARADSEEGVAAAEEADNAVRGLVRVSDEVRTAIGDLSAKSEKIGGMVALIRGIAAQTNLLALNAAIEAARAGEQGHGFAVVADEVRKLAEEAQQAASSIGDLIAEVQAGTERSVALVDTAARESAAGGDKVARTRDHFARIGESVAAVGERVATIVEAGTSISALADETAGSAEQVSAASQQTAASTQEIVASVDEIASSTENLLALAKRFRAS